MSFFDRLRDRWADFHPLLRLLLVVLVLAGIALASARPALGLYRQWRTGQNLDAAGSALERQLHASARDLSLQVLRTDPTRREALPILLRATEALGDPRRAEVALGILADANFPAADRQLAWQTACRSVGTWYVLAVWPSLVGDERTDPDFVVPLFDRLLRDGMPGDAARLLQEQPQPLHPALDLRLMQLLIQKGTDEAFREYQKTLVFRLGEDHAGSIVPLLDEVPQSALLPGIFPALSAWQEKQGPPDATAALRLARCEMATDPARADAIFATAIGRHGDDDRLAAARFSFQVRRLDDAARLLAKLPADAAAEAFDLRGRVFEQTNNLAAWAELLGQAPADAFLPVVLCERAHVAALMKDADARAAAEKSALAAAMESPADDALIRLARHAESRGLDAFARRVWIEAIRKRTGPLPLASQLKSVIENLAATRKERTLLEVLTTYRFIEPGNPVIIVQHDYLSCLNGQISAESLIADLAPIHERLPDALPVNCVLALGHLLEDQPEKALQLTGGESIDWFAANPSYRAIRGIALAAGGREEEAKVFLGDFPWDDLLPSEKRILGGLAGAAGIGGTASR